VQKMITIGLVGSAPHILKNIFILPELHSPNGNSHLSRNASIDADFLKEVPLRVSKFAKAILEVIFAPKNRKNLSTILQA
jgi:hypothetical protein